MLTLIIDTGNVKVYKAKLPYTTSEEKMLKSLKTSCERVKLYSCTLYICGKVKTLSELINVLVAIGNEFKQFGNIVIIPAKIITSLSPNLQTVMYRDVIIHVAKQLGFKYVKRGRQKKTGSVTYTLTNTCFDSEKCIPVELTEETVNDLELGRLLSVSKVAKLLNVNREKLEETLLKHRLVLTYGGDIVVCNKKYIPVSYVVKDLCIIELTEYYLCVVCETDTYPFKQCYSMYTGSKVQNETTEKILDMLYKSLKGLRKLSKLCVAIPRWLRVRLEKEAKEMQITLSELVTVILMRHVKEKRRERV